MDSNSIHTQHNGHATKYPRYIKLLAWLNIVTQIAFPLAGVFTPMMAGAGSDKHFLANTNDLTTMRTQVYTLSSRENIESVAKKYNITLLTLRQLNQLRTFSHGFDHLQLGDELDVPYAPLPAVIWDGHKSGSAESFGTEHSDVPAQKLAGIASQAGSFLSHNPNGDAAASMARGMATGAAGSEIQSWLSRFGTARVQLDVSKNFSLKNSQFDLLVPLYEQKDSLVFTQSSLHRTDDRTQSNLGMGYRWFTDTWMLGGNTFLDYDLSRDHARMGMGVEYWRDFLKLGVNGYQRLSNWKNSPDVTDYEERPANGWDIRAETWLPALPQLGGKLTYEQYYGQEVGLFGKDHRQRDPHAITAGITYTPVPLITLSAEQRQGKSSENDTRFGVEINYQLGMPWQQQLNPDAVAAMRSLAGSRYDLVERNNNIVLEYRKKEVIRLKTADLVTGYTGEQKSLGVSVNSKYGLERIDWSASPFIAAGGKIVQSGEDWTVVMPVYRSDVNSYTVKGVAVDRKGNRSSQAETQVTVQAPQVSAVQSTFTPTSTALLANGRSTQTLTLSVKDTNGHPVNIPVSDVEMKVGNVADASVSALVSKEAGVAELTVTAGMQPTALSLTPVVQGVSLPVAKVVISDNAPDVEHSSFSASPDTIPADNVATAALTITLDSKDGLPVTGVKDTLSLALSQNNVRARSTAPVTLSDITEEQAGRYTATLKGARAGVYMIVPQYNGTPLGSLSATVTLTTGSAAQAASEVSVNRASYVAGDDMTVTAVLKDAQDNAVTGAAVQLTSGTTGVAHATLKAGSAWTEGATKGTYTVVYTATTASTGNKASVKMSGWSTAKESGGYVITAPVILKEISVNGHTFAKDAKFPTTGFEGAVFTLKLDGGKPSDFTWTSDARWASVVDGVVQFTGMGTGNKVTITGTPNSGQGKPITFSFTLNLWLTDMQVTTSYAPAVSVCSNRGLKLPSASDVSNVTSSSGISTRSLGNAYGE
ncbi:inverse autotransporter beta domain-containing protein [Yersinia aldovae]|uniref:inverse autotransporter beta domain-containing protein n=1 Tax=Yersinia aldovae TaxID=29483 RepID=UPI001643C6A3|nr:inverse autotransporter beta domain-containing protein [Yersinia aldovae]